MEPPLTLAAVSRELDRESYGCRSVGAACKQGFAASWSTGCCQAARLSADWLLLHALPCGLRLPPACLQWDTVTEAAKQMISEMLVVEVDERGNP